MLNDREKLIELLCVGYHQRVDDICEKYENCDDCPYSNAKSCAIEINVDHLIANGVTVREKGEWKWEERNRSFWWRCSVCDCTPDGISDFCPACGADMRQGGADV